MKAMMIAFLSTASSRAVCIAVLSASVHVLIVKVGVLQSIVTSTEAGLLEMVVVQVVMVVVMVEQACCCLLHNLLAHFISISNQRFHESTFTEILPDN